MEKIKTWAKVALAWVQAHPIIATAIVAFVVGFVTAHIV